ncbi:hypothetical protein NC652_032088 [Populus alba x Populus x berolinensis]|nr:hypothetical protein NC652_032088 [Populus alba x Populus x berolinensis]
MRRKKLEEWKAEEEDRRLEKMAEEFIKKKAKKGKKGAGDGEAEKYVARYREESAKCAAVVEEAMKEVFGNGKGNGFRKRKGKGVVEGRGRENWVKVKEWMKIVVMMTVTRKNEKSVVLNNGNHSDSSNQSRGESRFRLLEIKMVNVLVKEDEVVEAQILEETVVKTEEVFVTEALEAEKLENVGPGSQCPNASDSGKGGIIESRPVIAETNGFSNQNLNAISGVSDISPETRCPMIGWVVNGIVTSSLPFELYLSPIHHYCICSKVSKIVDGWYRGQLPGSTYNFSICLSRIPMFTLGSCNFWDREGCSKFEFMDLDGFPDQQIIEILGMERLKTELQVRGLKCGGTLQERAARLFLLKSTPLEKLPKKLLAKK